jgi:hypothetical protein
MSEAKIIAEFIQINLQNIADIGKVAYSKFDAQIQIELKTAYTNYLNSTRKKYSQSKTFLLRDQPVELYKYYVPTSLKCGDKVIRCPDIAKCLDFTNRITISGSGGSGKSVLLKHLFLNCIQEKKYTPILIELRDLNSYEGTLKEFIFQNMSYYGFKSTENYINGANKSGHFCYFFDGYDEVDPKIRSIIIRQISTLAKQNPKCPIVISSRPDLVIEGLNEFSSYKMMPLNKEEAVQLVDKIPFDSSAKEKFGKELSSNLFDKHESFLSNPLLLSIMLLTFRENAEIPSKLSVFYSQAFEALFSRHDAFKDTFSRIRITNLDSLDFSRVFSLFCVQTYDKRIFKMSRSECLTFIEKSIKNMNLKVSAEDYLVDLKSAVCLLIEEGFDLSFTHRSFQEYFVALFISTAPPEIQTKLINECWINIESDQVMHLLKEMNPELFERLVLIPKLEEFFKSLKVVSKIGVTHQLNYLKICFTQLQLDRRGRLILYYGGTKGSIGRLARAQNFLVNIVASEYAKWTSPVISKNNLTDNKEDIRYLTKDLTIHSSIIKDLNDRKDWYSLDFLSAAYRGFKDLKNKHAKSTKTFTEMLEL